VLPAVAPSLKFLNPRANNPCGMAESANLVSEMDSAVQTPTITIALFVIATYNYYSRGMGRIQPTEHIASIKTNEVHVSFCHSNQRASYPPNKVKVQGSKATLTRPPPSAPFSALLVTNTPSRIYYFWCV
jgi:hypothetical protein